MGSRPKSIPWSMDSQQTTQSRMQGSPSAGGQNLGNKRLRIENSTLNNAHLVLMSTTCTDCLGTRKVPSCRKELIGNFRVSLSMLLSTT